MSNSIIARPLAIVTRIRPWRWRGRPTGTSINDRHVTSPTDQFAPVLVGTDSNAAPLAAISLSEKFWMLSIVAVLMAISGLDVSCAGFASSVIAKHFSHLDESSWPLSVTILVAIACVLPASRILSCCSAKVVLLCATLCTIVGEALAGASSSWAMLIIGRVVVGLATPIVLVAASLMVALTWEAKRRTLMLCLVSACYGTMIKVGPLVAGSLLERSTELWRWCFLIQLPLLGIAFVATLFFFPAVPSFSIRPSSQVLAYSWQPALLQASALICLVFPLMAGGTSHVYRWSGPSLVSCYLLGPCLLAGFFYIELKNEEEARYLPLHAVTGDVITVLMSIITFCSMFVLFASTYYFPIMFQLIFSSSPLKAAVQLLPGALSGTLATLIVTRIASTRYRILGSCIVSSLLMIIGTGLCSTFVPSTPAWRIYVFTSITALGLGGTASLGMPFTIEHTIPSRYGVGVAVLILALFLSAMLGVALPAMILTSKFSGIVARLRDLDSELAVQGTLWVTLDILLEDGVAAVRDLARSTFMGALSDSTYWGVAAGFVSLGASLGLVLVCRAEMWPNTSTTVLPLLPYRRDGQGVEPL